jgi:ankyrin repeat protein
MEGNTPLHYVMRVFSKDPQKSYAIATNLIDSGCKINLKNNEEWTAL